MPEKGERDGIRDALTPTDYPMNPRRDFPRASLFAFASKKEEKERKKGRKEKRRKRRSLRTTSLATHGEQAISRNDFATLLARSR